MKKKKIYTNLVPFCKHMPDRLHLIERIDMLEAESCKLLLRFFDLYAYMHARMGIRAYRKDFAAQVAIELQDIMRWRKVRQTIAVAGGIELDALALGNGELQNLCDDVPDPGKRILALLVVALDHVQMTKHAEIIITLHDLQNLFIITLIIFLLRTPFLKGLIEKELIINLMTGQDNEIKWIFIEKLLKFINGFRLHAKLHAEFNAQFLLIFLLIALQHFVIGLRITISGLILRTKICMLGKAYLFYAKLDCTFDAVLHGIIRVITEIGMHMIICKHVFTLQNFLL